jgi:hypothetical protein
MNVKIGVRDHYFNYCTTFNNSLLDINEFLPTETVRWCLTKLHGLGIDPENLQLTDPQNPSQKVHVAAYQQLRTIVRGHINSEEAPYLLESLIPTGGYNTAYARGGTLARVISENVDLVRSSGELENLVLPEVYQDFADDNQWIQREVEV